VFARLSPASAALISSVIDALGAGPGALVTRAGTGPVGPGELAKRPGGVDDGAAGWTGVIVNAGASATGVSRPS
jgi:hypothetical protein